MKKITALCLMLLLVASAVPALAQTPNPRAEAEWQHFLMKHPGLQQHPQWLSNQDFLKQHPNMTKWLEEHPAVFKQAREKGMWDSQGRWHDSNWWHQNHPEDVTQYHPEWAREHAEWAHGHEVAPEGRDGDWDEAHHWRAREWWIEHHREWVMKHHAAWLQENQEAPEHH